MNGTLPNNTNLVTRSNTSHRTPPSSRGTSPLRQNNAKSAIPSSPNKSRRSPSRTPPKNIFAPSPTRSRGNSPVKGTNNESGKRRRRRESETGSIERFDEDNNLRRIITSYNQAEDNINVVVRVRPLSKKETQNGDSFVIQFPGNGQVMVDGIPGGPSGGQKEKLFSYNVVFEPAATQEDVLQFSGMKRLIEMAVEGFRCTCFCYGQTGSGKTHTLTGPPGLFGLKTAPYSDKHGLVFRSFMYLFQQIQNQPDKHFVLKASYLEIYNEKVIDLLNPGSARKPLAVRWSKKARGFFVENLFTVDCEELDDLIAVLEEGLRNRAVGKHNMNDYSSRSHTILSVYITSEQPAENGVFISRTGKVNFVDLAGSEMTKKTQSEGKTLEEANNINKSLMVLGYCISSLSDSKKRNHIPYRDSKLTKLLADSLAGNGVTLMIACISPAKFNINETINTLRYAARAKKIRTKPVVLMDPREALILSLKREVDMLQTENEQLRSALNVYSVSTPLHSARTIDERLAESTLHVNLDELAKLDGPQLAELVRLYVKENGDLRKENIELFSSRELLQRDHELVCRENERLLKRLDEFSASSPPVPTRSAFSAEVLNNSDSDITTNVWTNPDQIKSMSLDSSSKEMPEFIQKEMDKRRIGNNPTKDLNLGNRRPSSWEEKPNAPKIVRTRSSTSDGNSDKGKILRNPSIDKLKAPTSEKRRFSIAKPKDDGDNVSKCSEEVFGSVIVPSDEDDL